MMENVIAVAAKSGIAKWVVITVVITLNVECLMPTDVQPLPAAKSRYGHPVNYAALYNH